MEATGQKLRLRPYADGDLERFEPTPLFVEDVGAGDWDWSNGPPPGRTWTLCRWDEQVLGVAGITGVAGPWRAWSLLAQLRPREVVQALWLADRALGVFQRERQAKIEALCRYSFPAARDCLRRLRFAIVDNLETAAGDYLLMRRPV